MKMWKKIFWTALEVHHGSVWHGGKQVTVMDRVHVNHSSIISIAMQGLVRTNLDIVNVCGNEYVQFAQQNRASQLWP